jgi:hypothetical protein
MSHRIRRAALVLAMTAALAGCGTEPTPVPGNAPVSAPASRPAIPPMTSAKPVGLAVPTIGLDTTQMMDLGLDPAGKLETPPDAKDVGWFDLSPTPGALGPSVLAAHVDWKGAQGPFFRLDELQVGDEIKVRRADGSTAVFETYDVIRYPKAQFPTDEVYGDTTDAEIRLITCGGQFDSGSGHYKDNVVAFARLVASA